MSNVTQVRCIANDADPDGTPHWKYRVRLADTWSGQSFPTEQLARAARNLAQHEELDDPPACVHGHFDCSCTVTPGGPCMDEQASLLEAAGFDPYDI